MIVLMSASAHSQETQIPQTAQTDESTQSIQTIGTLADTQGPKLKVVATFINVHSGPASEFPIFHVLSQDEVFEIAKERTGWYKIIAKRDIQGWINADDLSKTRFLDGAIVDTNTGSFDDFVNRDWELTIHAGTLDQVTALSMGAAWVWTPNLALEGTYTQALGSFADNKIWSIRLRQTFFPQWFINPYLAIGAGSINTKPRTNLVQSGDEIRQSDHYEVAIGVQYYLASQVSVRAEYRSLLALTDRDEQERLDQWMLGLSVFF